MRDVTDCAAAGQPRVQRWHVLGIAALALIITGGGAGSAAASPSAHDAGRRAVAHQAESPNVAPSVTESLLSRCLSGSWFHVWEEDTREALTYRPTDYPFGPSRGRDGYEFLAEGELIYHGIGPADGPLTSFGTWEWTAPDQIHIIVNDAQGTYIDETLRIVLCEPGILQVALIPDAGA